MRAETAGTTGSYFASRAAANTLVSDLSGIPLDENDPHVSHYQGPAFVDIATQFASTVGGWDQVEVTPTTDAGAGKLKDRNLAGQWVAHHKEQAVLALLTAQENLRRTH